MQTGRGGVSASRRRSGVCRFGGVVRGLAEFVDHADDTVSGGGQPYGDRDQPSLPERAGQGDDTVTDTNGHCGRGGRQQPREDLIQDLVPYLLIGTDEDL